MIINLAWGKSMEKMFEAVLKEKFSMWNRKFDPAIVSRVWMETVGAEGIKKHFKRVGWKLDMSVGEALEAMDNYAEEIEDKIRDREEGK